MALEEDAMGQAAPGTGRTAWGKCFRVRKPMAWVLLGPLVRPRGIGLFHVKSTELRFSNHLRGSPEARDHGRPAGMLVCTHAHALTHVHARTHTHTHTHTHTRAWLSFSQFSWA